VSAVVQLDGFESEVFGVHLRLQLVVGQFVVLGHHGLEVAFVLLLLRLLAREGHQVRELHLLCAVLEELLFVQLAFLLQTGPQVGLPRFLPLHLLVQETLSAFLCQLPVKGLLDLLVLPLPLLILLCLLEFVFVEHLELQVVLLGHRVQVF